MLDLKNLKRAIHQIAELITELRKRMAANDPCACFTAYMIGVFETELRVRLESPYLLSGLKQAVGSATHNSVSREKRRERALEWKTEYDELSLKNPHLSHHAKCGTIAKNHNVGTTTVKTSLPKYIRTPKGS